MKSSKLNSLNRLLTFLLIAALLVCTVGFAAGGLQPDPNEPDSGENGSETDKTDENKDGSTDINPPDSSIDKDNNDNSDTENNKENNNDETTQPPIEIPKKFYNTATGLEVSEEISKRAPIGFVINPNLPLYGISNADISIEYPIEDGTTRMLAYTTNPIMLWKVGELAPSRAFISSASSFLGGIVVSYGNDDIIKYSAWDASKIELDISKFKECYFIENTMYIYTSGDFVDAAIGKTESVTATPYKTMPYTIASDGNKIKGPVEATTVSLPYSETNETTFYYSEKTNQYLFFKSGSRKVDMLNGKNISYTNLFILFANATTYEKADGTELVMDTTSGGGGYYISNGALTEIRWSIDEVGNLIFRLLDGEKLTVNPGTSYIGYYKASNSSKVKIN